MINQLKKKVKEEKYEICCKGRKTKQKGNLQKEKQNSVGYYLHKIE